MTAGALLLAGAVVAAGSASRAAAQLPPASLLPPPAGRILVMPFENTTRDSRIVWLGEASSVLLTDDLNALGADPISREERREAFDRLQVPPVAMLTDATVIRIAQLAGAGEVVVGSLELAGETLTVRARSITLDTGRVRTTAVDSGPMAALFATIERVARRLAPGSSRTSEEIERLHPPLPAFEDYIKGLLAETPATQTAYLDAALKLAPSFDQARIALWDAYNEQGEHERALGAVQGIAAESPLARRARFLSGLSLLQLKKYDEAFAAFKALADARPTAAVLNDLGVVQLRRPTVSAQAGQPVYFFNKAAEADPNDADYFFNLGYAYWLARDTQAAIYWLREAVRRDPTDGEAHYILGAAFAASGNALESSREKELARRLSSSYADRDKRSPADAVPRGLERVKSDVELPHATGLETVLATSGQRDQQQLAAFYLDRGRRLFSQQQDREALLEFNRVLYLAPYDADALLLTGRIHLRAGRLREAIDALKVAAWSRDTADAHIALAEAYLQGKQPDEARVEAERALKLAPDSAAAKRLLEQAGPKP